MMLHSVRLSGEFYNRPPDEVAESLLGKLLVREYQGIRLSGFIVETEAYLASGDPASHSFLGVTKKNRSMFADAGTLYVYAIHAKHCMNVVTESQGLGSAVLIRAIEPYSGFKVMSQMRGTEHPMRLCRGPGMLCQALGIDRDFDGLDLTAGDRVWIEEFAETQGGAFPSKRTPRIGIRLAEKLPLRFIADGNIFVSGRKGDHSRRPMRGFLLDPIR